MRTYYKMSCGDHVELLEHYLERSRHTANDLRYLWCGVGDDDAADVSAIIDAISDAEHKLAKLKEKWWPEGVERGVQPEAVRHQGHATYQGGTVQHEIIGQG